MDLVTSPRLNGVLPPFEVVGGVSVTEPLVLSHARYLMAAVPKKSWAGLKRILWPEIEPSSNREEDAVAAKLVQSLPPFTENCQLPLVLSVEVMATPRTPPSKKFSRSLAESSFKKLSTVLPFPGVSSLIVGKLTVVKALPLPPLKTDVPVVNNTGASLRIEVSSVPVAVAVAELYGEMSSPFTMLFSKGEIFFVVPGVALSDLSQARNMRVTLPDSLLAAR